MAIQLAIVFLFIFSHHAVISNQLVHSDINVCNVH